MNKYNVLNFDETPVMNGLTESELEVFFEGKDKSMFLLMEVEQAFNYTHKIHYLDAKNRFKETIQKFSK